MVKLYGNVVVIAERPFMQEPEHCDMEQHKAVDVLTMITQSITHEQKETEEAAKSGCTECGEE